MGGRVAVKLNGTQVDLEKQGLWARFCLGPDLLRRRPMGGPANTPSRGCLSGRLELRATSTSPPTGKVVGTNREGPPCVCLQTRISQMARSFRHGVCAFSPETPAFPTTSCRNDRGTQWVTAKTTPSASIS